MKRAIVVFLILLSSAFGIYAQHHNFHYYHKQGKLGVYDERCNVLVPARYDTLIVQDTVWVDWCSYYSDGKGREIHYDGYGAMNRFGYLAKRNGKWGFLSAEGAALIPIVYDTIWTCKISKQYIVRQNGKYGMYGCLYFQELYPCEYDSIRCRATTDYGIQYCSDNDSTYIWNVKVDTWRDGHMVSRKFPAISNH